MITKKSWPSLGGTGASAKHKSIGTLCANFFQIRLKIKGSNRKNWHPQKNIRPDPLHDPLHLAFLHESKTPYASDAGRLVIGPTRIRFLVQVVICCSIHCKNSGLTGRGFRLTVPLRGEATM
jgi:hypothetical protein